MRSLVLTPRGREAAGFPTSGQYAVAGHDRRKGVMTKGLARGTRGTGLAQLLGQFAVGPCLPRLYLACQRVHLLVEGWYAIHIQHQMGQVCGFWRLANQQGSHGCNSLLYALGWRGLVALREAAQHARAGGGFVRFGQLHVGQAVRAPRKAAVAQRGGKECKGEGCGHDWRIGYLCTRPSESITPN